MGQPMIKRDKPEKGPEALTEILSQLFTARGWGRRSERLHLEHAWEAAAGPAYVGKTRAGSLRRGVLEIHVENAVLMQELNSFHKRRLLADLKRRLPNTPITDLRFKAGLPD
jgi:predicted nucleic acid-binding Zn ribbon protein